MFSRILGDEARSILPTTSSSRKRGCLYLSAALGGQGKHLVVHPCDSCKSIYFLRFHSQDDKKF